MQTLNAGETNGLHPVRPDTRQVSEERRPGITALFLQIKAKHPRWPDWRAETQAKQQWHAAEKKAAQPADALNHHLVPGQPLQPLAIGRPVGRPSRGQATLVVQVYTLGRGISVKGEGSNLPGAQGTFELEAHGKTFIVVPSQAMKSERLVTPIKRYIATTRLQVETVDQQQDAQISGVFRHSDDSSKTAILSLPQGFGKTQISHNLANRLGCTHIVDEWTWGKPVAAGALHLTNSPIEGGAA